MSHKKYNKYGGGEAGIEDTWATLLAYINNLRRDQVWIWEFVATLQPGDICVGKVFYLDINICHSQQ